MKQYIIIAFLFLLTGSISACAQNKKHQHQTNNMDTGKLSNHLVKDAFDAWQAGDSKHWLSFFEPNAKLLDDGHPRDFQKFSAEAIGHERFTSIDKVEDNGLSLFGKFHSDSWGDFKTYFKFHIGKNGKFDILEIGQADY